MKYHYPAVFLCESDGITVTFPDFPYLVTCGTTLEEACEKAEECLGMGITDYIQENQDLPNMTPLQDIALEKNESVVIVSVDLDEWLREFGNKSVRRNITLPQWMDQLATKRKINVSKVCQEALRKVLRV